MSAEGQPATAAQVAAAWDDPKLANILYHDWEAGTYDEKWSISFDERCIAYARDRFAHVAGRAGWPYRTSLELGCGTGFFTLNLKLAGVLDEGHVTDLSPGMVEVAQRNARSLGFEMAGRVADAERLPYDDDSFDLVIGHAVLHHIPDVEQAFREVLRVLKPGGRFVFAGDPPRHGDVIAPSVVAADLVGDDSCHAAACLGLVATPAGGARRVLACGGARSGRRHPHLPASRTGGNGATGRGRRRERHNRRADGRVVRLAGAYLRVRRPEGQAGDALGDLRHEVVATVLRRRQGVRACRAEGAVLQRRDHRAQAVAMTGASLIMFDLERADVAAS